MPTHTNISHLLKAHLNQEAWDLILKIQEINAAHDQVPVYLVGGAIRDILNQSESDDLDFVTEGNGIRLAHQVSAALGGDVLEHDRFQTANWFPLPTVFPRTIDFVTARREGYAEPAALPAVEPSSISDDLFRRDFTINAMAARIDAARFGDLYDEYGGLVDLEHQVVRVLHDKSFQDDPTRIWRAVRYETRLQFRLAHETEQLVQADLHYHTHLSADRIRHEWEKVMAEQAPIPIVSRLSYLNVLTTVNPALAFKDEDRLKRWFEKLSLLMPDLERSRRSRYRFILLMVHFELYGADIQSVADSLNVDRNFQKLWLWLETQKHYFDRLRFEDRPSAYQIVMQLKGAEEEDWFSLLLATWDGDNPHDRDKSDLLLRYLNEWRDVAPLSTGKTLMQLGLKPGPQFKVILDRLLEEKLNGTLQTADDEIELIKKIALKD